MRTEVKLPSDEAWEKFRHGYCGGSDAGAIFGLNPYKSPYALWCEKTGRASGFAGNIATEVGNELEDYVSRKFCGETGKKVRRKNRTIMNDKYPWAIANVDRMVVGEKAILECKTTSSIPVMRRTRNGEFPETWYCQVMHYMAVLGEDIERAYLAVLVNNREFHWFCIERDEAEIDALMEGEKAFWKYVEDDVPPPVDGMASTTDAIKRIFGEDDGTDAGELDLSAALENLRLGKEAKKAAEAVIAEAENTIRQAIGEHTYAHSGNTMLTLKSQSRETLDKKKLMADHPEIDFAPYIKTSTTRVLRTKEDKQ